MNKHKLIKAYSNATDAVDYTDEQLKQAELLLDSQTDEILEIASCPATMDKACEFNHYQDQLQALNDTVNDIISRQRKYMNTKIKPARKLLSMLLKSERPEH